MGDLTLVRADGTGHRTDVLGCSSVDVAPVDETRTVDREALPDLDRCSTCTWSVESRRKRSTAVRGGRVESENPNRGW